MTLTAALVLVVGITPASAHAQAAPAVKVGAFVDTYFAYDFGRPVAFDRAFTTQAARHDEFNVNLAYVDVAVTADRYRARLAMQAGTSVQSNYAGEPGIGANSGPALARHIQEAVVGARIVDGLWVDGGVFLSHIGSENWISRDNMTYTRSLIAEYSPYYQSGVKLTWQVAPTLSVLATVVNGWQIISENNEDKSFGMRVDWAPSQKVSVSYYNLLGNEQPQTAPSKRRFLNGATVKVALSPAVTLGATGDFGRQEGGAASDATTWWGAALITRAQVTSKIGIAARAEAYRDGDQTIVVTGSDPFRVSGFSLGIDVAPHAGLTLRTEIRSLRGKRALFPDRDAVAGLSRSNTALVTALAISM